MVDLKDPLNSSEQSLPKPQKDLPLPQKDLPLPEKQLPEPEKLLRAPTLREKYFNPKWIILVITFLLLVAAGMLYVRNTNKNINSDNPIPHTDQPSTSPVPSVSEDNQVFCTMDAKLCPDGSYVGRTGPNCEFAPCPN